MGVLSNPKHELFAQALADGHSADKAYALAGYKPNSGNCIRLKGNERVRARVDEILKKAAVRVEIDRAWVMEKLIANHDRAMQAEPVFDRKGVPTGEYVYQGAVANRSLELLGKELGMFVERSESNSNVTLVEPIDRPQRETREEWTNRRLREIARGMGAPTRATNGSHNGGLG